LPGKHTLPSSAVCKFTAALVGPHTAWGWEPVHCTSTYCRIVGPHTGLEGEHHFFKRNGKGIRSVSYLFMRKTNSSERYLGAMNASKEWSKSARANFGVNPTTRSIVQTIGVNPRSHQKQIAVTRFFRLQMQIRLTNPKYFWPQARDFGLHFGD
jgi:hypothetical protein